MSVLMGLFPVDPPRPLRDWQARGLPLCRDAIRDRRHGLVVACTGSGKSILLAEVVAHALSTYEGPLVVTTSSVRLVDQLAETLGGRVGRGLIGRYYTDAAEPDRPVVVCCNDSFGALAGDLGRLGRRCALWIADEAHRTETPEVHAAVEALAPERRLGFTATPYRSSAKERVSLFDEVLLKYTPGDALREGVIVPWSIVPWTGGEIELDDAVVQMVLAHTAGPGVVNASSIEDAEAFAARLSEVGVPALAVHSRLTKREQAARMDQLAAGELRAVVYPSLLSEGADFPWLTWMALRRKVQARVRFVQEVGRVLRTHPGKTGAVILDPLGLFARLSISYAEVVGWREPEPESPTTPGAERELDADPDPKMVPPFDALGVWASQLRAAATTEGAIPVPRHILGEADRGKVPTPRQVEVLRKMRWKVKHLPDAHARTIRQLIDEDLIGTQGLASDLLDLLLGLRSPWRPVLTVYPPPQDVLAAAAADMVGDWHAGGIVRRGTYVSLVLHGRRLVHREVRVAQAGDSSLVATLRAVHAATEAQGEDWAPIHVMDQVAHTYLSQRDVTRAPAVDAVLDTIPFWAESRRAHRSPLDAMLWRELSRATRSA